MLRGAPVRSGAPKDLVQESPEEGPSSLLDARFSLDKSDMAS